MPRKPIVREQPPDWFRELAKPLTAREAAGADAKHWSLSADEKAAVEAEDRQADRAAAARDEWEAEQATPVARPAVVVGTALGLLTRAEAAAALGHSLRSFERHVQPLLEARGFLVKLGGVYRIKKEDLDSWLDAQRPSPSTPMAVPVSLGSTPRSTASASAKASASPTTIALTAEVKAMHDLLVKRRAKRTRT